MLRTCFSSLTICMIAFTVTGTYGQQTPQFSQYFFNQYVYNPAYGGLDKALNLTAHGRAQWVGIEGSPSSQNVSAHSPMNVLHGGGGIGLINEQAGALRLTSVSLSYSYIIKTRIGYFSIGLSGGIQQAAIDGSKLLAPDGDYVNTIDHQDPILSAGAVSGIGPDGAAGLFFNNSHLSVGFSAAHLFPASISIDGTTSTLDFVLDREYYFQGSYTAKLSRSVYLRPAILLKSNGNYFQGEADVLVGFKQFVWVGAGFRGYDSYSQDAAVGIAGINISENLLLCYSYDFPMSALETVSQGSHEVMISYRLNLIKPALPGKAIFNPRF